MRFDLNLNTWVGNALIAGPAPPPVLGAAVDYVGGSTLVSFGGGLDTLSAETWLIDVVAVTAINITQPPGPTYPSARAMAASAVYQNTMYMVGGCLYIGVQGVMGLCFDVSQEVGGCALADED